MKKIRNLGFNKFKDIEKFFGNNYKILVIFDVGANIGKTTTKFIKYYKNATIYSFEPVKQNFNRLKRKFKNNKQVIYLNLALSNNIKNRTILVDKNNLDMSSFYRNNETTEFEQQIVKVETIDNFCKLNNISEINYLKIDTEGDELNVLNGAFNLLNKSKIDFIEVEVGFNKENKRHKNFWLIKKFLEKYNYRLFFIYEQVDEWYYKLPILRRANVLFISDKMIKMYNKQ